ncbi:MAG: FtsH protease activity modulator HflK [bacterium]|nr:FtsH protease activity modulator HflK [bacterium]
MNRRKIKPVILLGCLAVYILSGLYTVASDEMGVVTSFGKVIDDRIPPGIHYRFPWPITRLKTPQVTAIKRMSIGFKLAEKAVGTEPSRAESERLSGDANVISVAMMVQYTIRDPADYLYRTEGADFLVRKAGEALLCQKIGQIPVDDLLTVSKAEVEQYLRKELQVFSDRIKAGLQIRSCNLQKIEPPLEVIESFNDVSRAKANREKTINDAYSYQSELLPKARANAQQLVQNAQAQAAAKVSQAQGEVARFEKLLIEYSKNPAILRQRLYWDTLEPILAKARKLIIEDGKGDGTKLRIVTTPK